MAEHEAMMNWFDRKNQGGNGEPVERARNRLCNIWTKAGIMTIVLIAMLYS